VKILFTPLTCGMYGVCAQVNGVGVVKVNLGLTAEGGDGGERGRFSLRVDRYVVFRSTVPPSFRFVCSLTGGSREAHQSVAKK